MKPIEVRLLGRFRFESKVSGSHQKLLYRGVHCQTDSFIFMKGQQCRSKPKPNILSILQEGKIFQSLQGGIGIPHMYWCGQEEDYHFIVIENLQSTLQQQFRKCGNKFSLKTVLMLGCEIILILQYYHFKNLVHNHLKLQHLMIAGGKNYGKICLIDYSYSTRYENNYNFEHIHQNQEGIHQNRKINMLFSSRRYHSGQTTSRRDDLESLLYLMLYWLKGSLPWSDIYLSQKSDEYKSQQILQKKIQIESSELFNGYGDLLKLWQHLQNISFFQKPRYNLFTTIFKQRMQKNGFIDDKIYDWILLDQEIDDNDLEINFDVIPHEQQFIQKLKQEISKRQNVIIQKKNVIKKKQENKQCLIF